MKTEDITEFASALIASHEAAGSHISNHTVRTIADDLRNYPLRPLLQAIEDQRRDPQSSRFAPRSAGEILAFVFDGRPDGDRAWALVAAAREHSEPVVVLPVEAVDAAREVETLRKSDVVGARMAFLASYRAKVAWSRGRGSPVTLVAVRNKDVSWGAVVEYVSSRMAGESERTYSLVAKQLRDELLNDMYEHAVGATPEERCASRDSWLAEQGLSCDPGDVFAGKV